MIRPAAIFVALAIIIMVATILTIIYLRFISFVLSLALLGLLCCTRTSSTCRERGLLLL